LFDARQWPEGYNFPACQACNAISRQDEKILAYLARLNHGDRQLTNQEKAETQKAFRGLATGFPVEARSMAMSANQVRSWLKGRGETKPSGTIFSDLPVANIGAPRFRTAIKVFSLKLIMALHYKHTGNIVPTSGVLSGRWLSNLQIADGVVPEDISQVFAGRVVLQRCRQPLSDQFDYMYGVAGDGTLSGFLCGFRRSFAIVGMVVNHWDALPKVFDEDLERGTFKDHPFR
jgi:hypothetical protein